MMFNSTSRYPNDLLTFYTPYFEQILSQYIPQNFREIKQTRLKLKSFF